MNNPLIHIGYPKTASSWFQRNFFPFVQNVSHVTKSEINEKIIYPNSLDFDPEHTKEYFGNKYDKRLVISHENLVGPVSCGGVNAYFTKEMAMRLNSLFPDSEIIIFIRNQPDMISSAYIQEVRAGGTYSINNFLFHKVYKFFNNIFLFSFEYLEYHKVIKLYRKLFGENKVHVFLFEEFEKNNGNFIRDYIRKFDLKVDETIIDYKKINVRYRKFLVHLVRFSNLFTKKNLVHKYYLFNIPFWYPFNRRIFEKLNRLRIFGKYVESKDILGKKNFYYINNFYKNSNQRLVNDLKINSIKEYNYPL